MDILDYCRVFTKDFSEFIRGYHSPGNFTLKTPLKNHALRKDFPFETWQFCDLWLIGLSMVRLSSEVDILPETNSSPLKIDPWKRSSYWKPPFLGAMLVLGSVQDQKLRLKKYFLVFLDAKLDRHKSPYSTEKGTFPMTDPWDWYIYLHLP